MLVSKSPGKPKKVSVDLTGHTYDGRCKRLVHDAINVLVRRPRTSADERDVVWAPRCRDCVWAVAGFGRFFFDLSFLREQSP